MSQLSRGESLRTGVMARERMSNSSVL